MKIVKNEGNYFSICLEPITFTQRENVTIYLHCLKIWNDNNNNNLLPRLEIDIENHIFSFLSSNKPFIETYPHTYDNLVSLYETFQEFLLYLKKTKKSFMGIHPNHFIKIDDLFLYVGFEEMCEYNELNNEIIITQPWIKECNISYFLNNNNNNNNKNHQLPLIISAEITNKCLSLYLKRCWKQDIQTIRYTPLHQIISLYI
jgi:hypothetical protein